MPSDRFEQITSLGRSTNALVCLYQLGRPSGETELARLMKISAPTARKYLRNLCSRGLVERGGYRNGYYINRDGLRLLLGDPESFGPGNAIFSFGPSFFSVQEPEFSAGAAEPAEGEEFPSPEPEISASQPEKNSSRTEKTGVRTENNARRYLHSSSSALNSRISSEAVEEESNARASPANQNHLEAVKRALQAAGLSWNRRTRRLARLPHITPDYITAQHLLLKSQGRGQFGGLLVSILESGDPAPPLNANRHLEGCRCHDCHYLARSSWGRHTEPGESGDG